DRAAFLDAVHDSLDAQLLGKNHRRRASDRAVAKSLHDAARVIVAPADCGGVATFGADRVPEGDRGSIEEDSCLLVAAGFDFDGVDLIGGEIVLPRAADANVADLERRMVDRKERAL